MQSLRLNEHYTSPQGEGPNVGKMTQFVRFSGCNLRCPGWPCDTMHAVDPALWKDDPLLSARDVLELCVNMRASTGAAHICITGGEPFIQPAGALAELVRFLLEYGFTIDVFTNGTRALPIWAIVEKNVTVVMDWKLTGSGDHQRGADERLYNLADLPPWAAVKFVIKDEADFNEAMTLFNSHPKFGALSVYYGAVWETDTAKLVEWCQENQLPWLLNVQVHKYIWPDKERGI
jgi:7-carboxy-7-deazaguanine synthase